LKPSLLLIILSLPALGQVVYSGAGSYSGSAAYGALVCGPPAYSCFSTSIAAVALPASLPNWGPYSGSTTTSDPYTVQTWGNRSGAGTVVTPSDFGNAIVRCTDANTAGASVRWGTVDNGEPNIFLSDDSGLILHVSGSGTRYLFGFNPSTMACSLSGITWAGSPNVIADHSSPTTVYVLTNNAGAGGNYGTAIYQDTLPSNLAACSPSCAVSSHTLLYDFRSANCLQNSWNGTPTWASSGWTGLFADTLDDSTFMLGFGTPEMSGKGVYAAVWRKSYGLSGGCDLWNTLTGQILLHDGTQLNATVQTVPSISPLAITSVVNFSGNTWQYDGAIKQNGVTLGSNALVGYSFTMTGFSQSWNNGTFTVTGSSGTYIQVTNASGAADSTGSASGTQVGPDKFYLHEVFPAGGNNTALVSVGSQAQMTNGIYPAGGYFVWTNTGAGIVHCGQIGGPYCDGHEASGSQNLVTGHHIHSYASPNPDHGDLITTTSCNDNHLSWNHNDANDSFPVMNTSQEVGSFYNLLGGTTPPCAYYDEIMFMRPDAAYAPRAAHTFNSGWSWNFEGSNAIGVESSSGKFAAWVSDGWGQFGSTGGTGSCHLGGPDWAKSDSTDYTTTAGSAGPRFNYIMPHASGNSGNHIYQATFCSATPCATGPTQPSWPQSAGGVISETAPGNITWTEVGVSDCRTDVLIVKLTRGERQ